MAFLPPINARAYPYGETSTQDSEEPSRGGGRKRRLQVAVVDEVDYDVYYGAEPSGVSYRSTRAMDEHVLARMRDDIRRANVRQANPESAIPEREVGEEDKLQQALQDYNERMAQSYEEALKLPLVLPTQETKPEDVSGSRTPQQRRNQSLRSSPAPKDPTPAARSRQSTSTTAPRRSVSERARKQSKSQNGHSSQSRTRSNPYGATRQASKSARAGSTKRGSRAESRHSSRSRQRAQNERRAPREDVQEYSSGEIDDFIRKEQQRSGRHAGGHDDVHSSVESDTERREKLRRAQALALRLQDDTGDVDNRDWE